MNFRLWRWVATVCVMTAGMLLMPPGPMWRKVTAAICVLVAAEVAKWARAPRWS